MRKTKELIKSVKAYISAEKETGIKGYHLKNTSAIKTNETKKSKAEQLRQFHKKILSCEECELHRGRSHIVLGEGNPGAKLVFVGEAPGFEEDKQGRPFVGRAGQLLTKMIEAMKLKREDVFICNVLKCRPPQNRDPFPTEIAICRSYLLKQLDIIAPKVICCLGRHAVFALLGKKEPITTLRGKFCDFRGIKTMPTFHPAYLLRNPNGKILAWQDLKKIINELKK